MEILEYQDFEETISLTDYSSNKAWYPGEYSENTEIGEKDGETYFIKDKKNRSRPCDAVCTCRYSYR